jgi:hypothetical protein
MLEGIAFLTITIATITSTFVTRAERERDAADDDAEDEAERRIDVRLDRLEERFDQLEALWRKALNA